MTEEQLAVNRTQVFYEDALAVAAGQTLPEAQTPAGAAGAYPIWDASGNGWLLGYIKGTAAPASGFPRVRFWNADGDATALTAAFTVQLTVDPNNAFTYQINLPLYTPFFTIEWTQGAGVGTVSGIAWVLPAAPGASGISGGGGTVFVKDAPLTPLGYGQGTVDGTTAKDLATLTGSAIPAGALYAAIQVGVGGTNVACTYRDDGVAPTATIGFPLLTGFYFFYEGTPLSNMSLIGSAAGPTTISVLFYR